MDNVDGSKVASDIPVSKPIMFLGKDIKTVPCFRKSFIYGICIGVVAGLGTFLITSKAHLSSHVGFTSIWIGVFGYWFPCRYKYESSILKAEAVRQKYLEKIYGNFNSSEEGAP